MLLKIRPQFAHLQIWGVANLFVALCSVNLCFAQTVELNQLSLPELITRAESGDPPAQVQMGLRFISGRGVIYSVEKVREWMEKAAQAGHRTAIGVCARNGWGRDRDLKLSFECFQEQALKGDITAVRNLGSIYEHGLGVEKDTVKAFGLYKKAAETKDPLAYLNLGVAYVNGVGTEVDLEKGRFYLSEADKIGDCQAAYILAQLTLREGSKSKDSRPFVRLAWDQFSRSADAGYLPALDHLCREHKQSAPDKAFEYWQKAAALGSPTGMHLVGTCYEKGIHVKADKVTPLFLYRRAAELGYADSHLRLADLLGAQPEVARNHWLKAGELGSGAGYHCAGLSYEKEKDYKKANELYEMAIKLGYLGSEYQLGLNQVNGRGINQSLEKGASLILRSLKNGHVRGFPEKEYLAGVDADIAWFTKLVHSISGSTDSIKVGSEYRSPSEASVQELMSEAWKLRLSGRGLEAVHLYLVAGSKGEGEAWHRLADMCYDGKELPKQDILVISLLYKGAALGSGQAFNLLGYHYSKGLGCEKDEVSARYYYERAADLKSGVGAANLAIMWSQGLGGPKDLEKAFSYYQKADELNLPRGTRELGHCYTLGAGAPKNLSKAFECYLKAAKMGDRDGAFNAAYAYQFGKSVPRDVSKAISLYKLAVAQDSPPACHNLAVILNRGEKGVQKDAGLARALFEKAARLGNKESQDYLRRAGLSSKLESTLHRKLSFMHLSKRILQTLIAS